MAGIFDISGNDPLTIASNQGTGFAKVIPAPEFKPADTSSVTAFRWKQYQDEKARNEKIKQNLSKIPKVAVATMDRNKNEIATDFNNLVNLYKQSSIQGVDPEANPDVIRAEQAFQQKVKIDEQMGKMIGTLEAEYSKNPTKYNQQMFEKGMDAILKAPTLEEAYKAANDFKLIEDVNPYEGIDGFLPQVKGYGVPSKAEVDAAAKNFVMATNQKIGAAIEQEKFKDDADALTNIAEEMYRRLQWKARPQGSGGGGITINTGEGTFKNDRYTMAAVHNPNLPYSVKNEANQVVFSDVKAGKSVNPLTLDVDGTPVFSQPLDVIKRGDKYFLRAQRSKRVNAEEFNSMSSAEKAMFEQMFDPETNETSYVQIKGTKIEELPFKRNSANWTLIKDTYGYDPIKLIEDYNSTNSGEKTDDYTYARLQQLYKENRELAEKALSREKAADRKFTAAEKAKYDQNSKEVEELRAKLKSSGGQNKQSKPITANEYKNVPRDERYKYKKNADGTYSLK